MNIKSEPRVHVFMYIYCVFFNFIWDLQKMNNDHCVREEIQGNEVQGTFTTMKLQIFCIQLSYLTL